MPLQIIRQDITKIECDAIVNPSNRYLEPGGGADLAIHEAAGPELFDYCQKLGGCEVGKAVITPGFNLSCKYVIHTAGPRWSVSKQAEHTALLESCYKECLQIAKENSCESVAIPLISAGTYGFPTDIVLKVATDVIRDFVFENEMLVYLVVYNKRAFRATKKVFSDVKEYISDEYVKAHSENEIDDVRCYKESAPIFDRNELRNHRRKVESEKRKKQPILFDKIESAGDYCIDCCEIPVGKNLSLDDFLVSIDESFAVTLLKLIDIKGMTDVECYKKANVSKQTWSKIMNNKDYKPSKNTIIAFAISLELTLSETLHLLETVGFTLSKSIKFDVIIRYFIERHIYDIFQINEVLFDNDQVGLGV